MMMLRMMMLRRRTMDDVGMLMLRRRTDPKTEDHTLCEPAQSKYMSTFHKQTRMSPECGHIFCVSLRSRNACQDFTRAILCGKNPRPRTTAQTLCEPARLKRMSRFHKSRFMRNSTRKFTGKMPLPRVSTLIKHRPLHLP